MALDFELTILGLNPNFMEVDGKNVPPTSGYVFEGDETEHARQHTVRYWLQPDAKDYLPDSAFAEASGLTEIYIPRNIRVLGEGAFYGCYNLSSVTFAEDSMLESAVTYNNQGQGPTFLKCCPDVINFPASNTNFKVMNGILFDKNDELVLYPKNVN